MAKRTARREQQPRPPEGDVQQGTAQDRAPVALMDSESSAERQQMASPGEEHPPQPDAIARRAYELYCERGYQDGRDMDDWLQAERELREHHT